MTLSCGCDDWGDDADWYWNGSEFRPLELKRGTRCKACKTLIKPGVVCLALDRFRGPKQTSRSVYMERTQKLIWPPGISANAAATFTHRSPNWGSA